MHVCIRASDGWAVVLGSKARRGRQPRARAETNAAMGEADEQTPDGHSAGGPKRPNLEAERASQRMSTRGGPAAEMRSRMELPMHRDGMHTLQREQHAPALSRGSTSERGRGRQPGWPSFLAQEEKWSIDSAR